MNVLPLNSVHHDDKPILGAEITNLAVLLRLGIPVVPALAIVPPTASLISIFRNIDSTKLKHIDSIWDGLKSQVLGIPVPEDLVYQSSHEGGDPGKSWRDNLNIWLSTIHSQILRGDFKVENLKKLSPQLIVHQTFTLRARGYVDRLGKVIILDNPKLSLEQEEDLSKLLKSADQKIIPKQVFECVFNGRFEISGMKPLTEEELVVKPISKQSVQITPVLPTTPALHINKTILKTYLNLNQGFTINHQADGVYIESGDDIEITAQQIIEACNSYPNQPVIFHPKNLDVKQVELIAFIKKNKCPNLELVLEEPKTFDFNINFLLEISTPEMLQKLPEITSVSSFFIDLNKLGELFFGHPITDTNPEDINLLIDFIKPKLLSVKNRNLIFKGEILKDDDVLNMLVEIGSKGVVLENLVLPFVKEKIAHFEGVNFKKSAWKSN